MAGPETPGAFNQSGTYGAEQTRRAVFFGSTLSGIQTQAALQVTAGGAMTVNVASGSAVIAGTTGATQGYYYGLNTSTYNVAIAASDPSKPRIDIVCASIQDSAYAGGTNAYVIQVVTGTPTTGATLANLLGVGALPASSLLLAYVLVPAASSIVTNGNIGDQRVMYGPPPDPVTTTISSNTNAVSGNFYLANANGGAFTLTLPAPTANQVIGVKKTDSSANAITVNASTNAGTIDGPGAAAVNTVNLGVQRGFFIFEADGSKWNVISMGGIFTAPASFKPGNPSSTLSTTQVMMGLGSTITYTPQYSGNVKLTVAGMATIQTGSAIITANGKYGTGGAPANGAAVTGTTFGNTVQLIPSSANASLQVGWPMCDRVTGLTVGTAVWFDIALKTSNASDAAVVGDMAWIVEESL